MTLPKLVPVLQHFPSRRLTDVTAAVRADLAARGIGTGLPRGSRVAIGAGSRGISNLSAIVRATAAHFRELGLEPFVFPAMGSHGGGTAQGQIDVLAHYGVTEETAGCPIVSSLEVVSLGRTPDGIDTWADRCAWETGAIFLVNRVKWHTTFEAPLESGLMKMAAIGLGKLEGASQYHCHVTRLGFGAVIRSVGRHVISTGRLLGGLAIIEDAHHDTGLVAALPAAEIEQREEELLALARSWMARILFDEVDILVVDEMGKQISGVGMDSKVINRHPYGGANLWPWAPRITRVYVRSLSPQSYGNAVGVGMADMISDRLYKAIDWNVTKVNAFTASNLSAIKTPLRAANDREALETLSRVVGRFADADVTCVWIRNTLELSRIVATENLLGAAHSGDIEPAGSPVEWEWDRDGNLAGGLDRVAAAVVPA